MALSWLGRHENFISMLMRFGNAYALNYNTERDLGLGVSFSASEVQTIEYILKNEDRYPKMAEIAAGMDIPASTFSKNIARMVEKGLLEKFHMSNNRKEIILRVSEYGREVYEKYCRFIMTEVYAQAFEMLDSMPAEYEETAARAIELIAKKNRNTAEPTLQKIE